MKDNFSESQMSRRGLLGRAALLAVSLTGVSKLAFAAKGPAWPAGYEAVVDLELNKPEGGRYHRPYLAVWIEDEDGKAVRSLILWVQTSGRGPNWIPDLKRWYRKELNRRKSDGGDLVDILSSATRGPGQYSVVWNGKNDDGDLVPAGKYTLSIEAAREHGTYQLIREDITIGNQPFKKDLGGNVEVKGASVEFRKRG